MKTIGMLGGMSWESTQTYYRLVNQRVSEKLGGLHSAKVLLFSVDFQEVEEMQNSGDWERAGDLLSKAATSLAKGGADFLVICTNTMHKVADAIVEVSGLPILHIADATAAAVRAGEIQRIGLLGTRFTMEQDFYRGRLEENGLEVLVPDEAGRELVHRVIYDELCLGRTIGESRDAFRGIIADLVSSGAEGIILGCTEIGLLVGPGDAMVPVFDTTTIHARAAADRAMG